jgi:hypothetical protein
MALIRHNVHTDPAWAAQLAKDIAYDQGLMHASPDMGTWAELDAQTASFRQQRIALYEQEVAKETPPAQIYDKLMEFARDLPASYKQAMGLA